MMHAAGRSLELFGRPEGMLTVAVVNGRCTIEWKVAGTSRTYKQWEAEALATEPTGE